MTDLQAKPSLLSGGRHPVNVGHLVMGLAFLGLVGVWAAVAGEWIDDEDIRWLLPLPWVLAGLGGLVALAVTGARRHATKASGWVDTPGAVTETVEEPYEASEDQA